MGNPLLYILLSLSESHEIPPRHRSYRGVGIEHRAQFLDKIMAVTGRDLARVGEKYMSALFDEGRTRTVVACHPSKIDEIREGFKG